MNYIVLDTETTIIKDHGRKASPFNPDNYIVAVGYCYQDEQAKTKYFTKKTDGWFQELLEGVSLVVGMNIKFDILHIISTPKNKEAWLAFIDRGGSVWNIDDAEYFLEGMIKPANMLSLDRIAATYGGTQKVDVVKALWELGTCTKDIDKSVLLEYLEEDVRNTHKIYKGQLQRAHPEDEIVITRAGNALLAVIEMENNGLLVDVALADEQKEKLLLELKELTDDLNSFVQGLPFEFSWASQQHKAALLWGGTIHYPVRIPRIDKKGNTMYKTESLSVPVTNQEGQPVLYTSGKRFGEQKFKTIKIKDPSQVLYKWGSASHTFKGLADADALGVKRGSSGFHSVSRDAIERLPETVEELKKIKRFQEVSTLLNTFYTNLVSLVGSDNYLHGEIRLNNTITGRFSSANPNLQNLPSKQKAEFKKIFTSRYGDDGYIVQCDFKSLEVFVNAILTGSEQMLKDLEGGLDMHSLRLSGKLQEPYEYVLEKVKAGDKSYVDQRRDIKHLYSFKAQYGGGDKSLAASTGLPISKIKDIRAAEEARYPEVQTYYKTVEKAAGMTSTNRTRYASRIFVDGTPAYLGYARTISCKLYAFYKMQRVSFQGVPYWSFNWPSILNSPSQGDAAEFMKAAMNLSYRFMLRNREEFARVHLVSTVHDAEYLDVHKDSLDIACQLLYNSFILSANQLWEETGNEIAIQIPAEVTYGKNMYEEMSYKVSKDNEMYQRMLDQFFNGRDKEFKYMVKEI